MMSLTFGLFTQVSGSGPLGPLVVYPAMNLSPSNIFSSPEPKAPGELIGWEGSVVPRPSVRPSSVVRQQFQMTSPLKLLGQLLLNFIYSLQGL